MTQASYKIAETLYKQRPASDKASTNEASAQQEEAKNDEPIDAEIQQ